MSVLEDPPVVRTFTLRYDFQIEVCEQHEGTILNIGCNEDPAELQARFGKRIVNCDMEAWDHHMDRPNVVDLVFNCLDTPWSFEDGSAEVVLLGDILEHFPRIQMVQVLEEARRVADYVAITVPEDTRIDEDHQQQVWTDDAYNLHTTVVTRELLSEVLSETGWQPERFIEGDWGFDDIKGYCVLACRAQPQGAFATGGIVIEPVSVVHGPETLVPPDSYRRADGIWDNVAANAASVAWVDSLAPADFAARLPGGISGA